MGTAKQNSSYAIPRPYVKLGNYLQVMRTKAGLTQRQVAEALNYSSAQLVSNFERGISVPPLSKMKILLRIYPMPLDKVLQLVLATEHQRMIQVIGNKTPVKKRTKSWSKEKLGDG